MPNPIICTIFLLFENPTHFFTKCLKTVKKTNPILIWKTENDGHCLDTIPSFYFLQPAARGSFPAAPGPSGAWTPGGSATGSWTAWTGRTRRNAVRRRDRELVCGKSMSCLCWNPFCWHCTAKSKFENCFIQAFFYCVSLECL